MTGFSKNVVTPKGLVPQQILVSLAKGWIVEGSRSWGVEVSQIPIEGLQHL